MFEQLKSIYQRHKNLISFLIFVSYGFLVFKLLEAFSVWGMLALFIPSSIYLYYKSPIILTFIQKWSKTWLLIISFVFFICTIGAEKVLNNAFAIETQYLHYAPVIFGAALTFVLLSSMLSLFLILKQIVLLMFYTYFGNVFQKYKDKSHDLEFNFQFFVYISLLISVMSITQYVDKLFQYYPIADAFQVSNCGAKIDYIWYIRKNDNQCYAINLERPLDPQFTVIASPNGK